MSVNMGRSSKHTAMINCIVGFFELLSLYDTGPPRAVQYDDIYRMDTIKSILFHIMFYRLFRGVAEYIVSGKTFS